MPSESQHLSQADRNEDCFQSLTGLDPSRFTDWEVVTLFYSALHYVEAYLARNGVIHPHPKRHAHREEEMVRHAELDAITENYLSLRNYSQDARYELHTFSADEVAMFHQDEYLPIRENIRALLGR